MDSFRICSRIEELAACKLSLKLPECNADTMTSWIMSGAHDSVATMVPRLRTVSTAKSFEAEVSRHP